jgi:alpha-L-rhamnosidase
MNYVNDTKYDHVTLIEENRNRQYADWVSYEPLESHDKLYYIEGTKKIKPEALDYWNFLSTAYWAMDAAMMADMAAAIGQDAECYLQMERDAKEYIKKFFNISVRIVRLNGRYKFLG